MRRERKTPKKDDLITHQISIRSFFNPKEHWNELFDEIRSNKVNISSVAKIDESTLKIIVKYNEDDFEEEAREAENKSQEEDLCLQSEYEEEQRALEEEEIPEDYRYE